MLQAGWGCRVSQLIVGSNRNDILTRFFETGVMTMEAVEPSLSPSMDIQISSNFERLLFDMLGRDGTAVAQTMIDFRSKGEFCVSDAQLSSVRRLFDGFRLSDKDTLKEIRHYHETTGELLDPHSVVAVVAAREKIRDGVPVMACMATAHPAKFPDAVRRASGVHPELPAYLSDLFEREERFEVMDNDLDALKGFVLSHRLNV